MSLQIDYKNLYIHAIRDIETAIRFLKNKSKLSYEDNFLLAMLIKNQQDCEELFIKQLEEKDRKELAQQFVYHHNIPKKMID